jgi:hypothetical protein
VAVLLCFAAAFTCVLWVGVSWHPLLWLGTRTCVTGVVCLCCIAVDWCCAVLSQQRSAAPLCCAVLQDALLPDGARKINRDALLNLLTCPPPYHVTMSVRQAMRLLSESTP